jgi:nitrogen fixation NifU-like protein
MANLEDLYREIILDHYRSPRNRGELEVPPAIRSEGFNPLCGDEITLFLDVDDGVVDDVRIAAQGCSISQSSASMMSVAIKGKPITEVRELARQFKAMMSIHESALGGDGDEDAVPEPVAVDEKALGDLAALQGVVKFPPRIKCATLAWITLSQGLDEAETTAD